MKDDMRIYYDEEGDFLEITKGEIADCSFKNMDDGVFQIIDDNTKEVKGFGIYGFKERTKGLKDIKVKLPFKVELSV